MILIFVNIVSVKIFSKIKYRFKILLFVYVKIILQTSPFITGDSRCSGLWSSLHRLWCLAPISLVFLSLTPSSILNQSLSLFNSSSPLFHVNPFFRSPYLSLNTDLYVLLPAEVPSLFSFLPWFVPYVFSIIMPTWPFEMTFLP